MKALLSIAAIAALLTVPASAEDATRTVAPADTMATTPADSMAKTPADAAAAAPAAKVATASGEIRYLPSQSGGEFLASRVMGAYVVNDANDTVGDVNDIVLDKGGKVAGVVVGVGGFLGMGERNVAVA